MKIDAEKNYARPMVLSHQPIRFETAQSWNAASDNSKATIPPNNGSEPGQGFPGQGNGNGNGKHQY